MHMAIILLLAIWLIPRRYAWAGIGLFVIIALQAIADGMH